MTDTGKKNPLVLVADDELEARQLLRRILERENFVVKEARDGHQTIELAQQLRPDLILLDIQMPGIDGFETVRLLREDERTVRIPIIVVSAAARDPADVARGLGLGADDYLRKPYNISELVARANANIRARQLEERLKRRTEELEGLIQIGGILNQALELDDLADRVVTAVLGHIPAESMLLALINPQGQVTMVRQKGVADTSLSLETLPGYVLANGEATAVSDLNDPEREEPINTIFNDSNCKAGIAAPLIHRGEVLGVLALGDSNTSRFSSASLRLLRNIAEQAALAIRNAQLYTELRGYATGLESMVEARTAALQSAQAQLVRAEKLAALGTLAAGIAHEVNNPLQPLLTNLEMALEDVDSGRPADRELLEVSQSVVQRIQRIVSRLLDFARPGQSVMQPLDLNDLVDEVLTLAGKQLEHAHIKLRSSLTAEHPIVGSADQLKQVFLNLVVNAMEAMPNGGTLTISTHEVGDQAVLKVRDTGLGITASELPQVFDPFFTTKADGTGLGLAVSYGIIEGHGGLIEVDSKPDNFTEFTVKLPLYQGDSTQAHALGNLSE
jgi:two-component system, NtrC family, sensor kinase